MKPSVYTFTFEHELWPTETFSVLADTYPLALKYFKKELKEGSGVIPHIIAGGRITLLKKESR